MTDRLEELMTGYYGMDNTSSSSTDIDSSSFDLSSHLTTLLRTSTYASLFTLDTCLVSEMASLDTNLQNLVYENYTKFISATDTIRSMKSNVACMQEDMSCVLSHMDTMETISNSIEKIILPKREKMMDHLAKKRLLERLEILYHLPQRLSR